MPPENLELIHSTLDERCICAVRESFQVGVDHISHVVCVCDNDFISLVFAEI